MTLLAQLSPELAQTGFQISLADILRTIFGSAAHNTHLVAFPGDPSARRSRSDWAGGRIHTSFGSLEDLKLSADHNVFFCIAGLSRADMRRVNSAATSQPLFVLDDVGTKVDRAKVDELRKNGVVPVMVVQTSTGNFQYSYLFDTPVLLGGRSDPERGADLHSARRAVASGNWGDKSITDNVRLMRLPFGINGKARYGTPQRVELCEWNPAARVTPRALADALGRAVQTGMALPTSPSTNSSTYNANLNSPIVQLAQHLGLSPVLGTDGRVHARCPNSAEHTGGDDTGFAFLSNGGCKCHHAHCTHRGSHELFELMYQQYETDVASDIAAGRLIEALDGSVRDNSGVAVPRYANGFLASAAFALAPISPEELKAAVASYSGGPSLPEWLERMNRQFALVRNITRVVDRKPGLDTLYNLMQVDHFQRFYNEPISVHPDKKSVPLGQAWLNDHRSSKYDSIALYEPGQEPAGVLNPFTGMPTATSWHIVAGARSDHGPIVTFIEEVIAAGRADVANYILNWLAWKVQNPLLKPGVNLVLVGAQGTGKSFFADMAVDIFGPRLALTVTQASHALGNFNSHLQHKCLVVFDEALYGKDNRTKGVYKNLTTQDRLIIERKGLDVQQDTNHLAIIVTSNSLASVPVEPDDRRATVMRVSESRRQDHTYFGELYEAWVNGGREAFIASLLQRDVSQFNPRKPHPTPEKGEVAAATADLATAFWAELLERGAAPAEFPRQPKDWDAGPVFICDADLYAEFKRFADGRGQRAHLPQPAELYERVGQLCPGRSERRKGPRQGGRQQPRGHEYPSIAECRAALERALQGQTAPGDPP